MVLTKRIDLFFLSLLVEFVNVSLFSHLHHNIVVVDVLKDLVCARYILMIYPQKNLYFLLQLLLQTLISIEFLLFDDLDGSPLALFYVDGAVHRARGAFADKFTDLVLLVYVENILNVNPL